jgi:Zn-dependent oligopeptidase
VKAMIIFSQCEEPFSEESFNIAQRVKSRTKMFKLAEQAFRSKLEIAALSEFDLKGSETIMDLQTRIATAFIPHCCVEKNDMEHLVDILNSNAVGGQYRYLWSDFSSASVFMALKQHYETHPESAMKRFREDFRRTGLFPGAASDYRTFLGLHGVSHLATTDLLKLYKIQ